MCVPLQRFLLGREEPPWSREGLEGTGATSGERRPRAELRVLHRRGGAGRPGRQKPSEPPSCFQSSVR